MDNTSFQFPFTSKIMSPMLLAKELIDVQPMSAPSDTVFYMTYEEKPDPRREVLPFEDFDS